MLLAIDVGNTNITIGVFDKEKLITTFRMTTKCRELLMNTVLQSLIC